MLRFVHPGNTTALAVHIRTTKRSIRCMCTESMLKRVGSSVRATNVSVRSGKLVLAAQAVFLPQRRN
jgi:hypothetical protein